MVTTSKSMHREVQIKHDLMTHKCKYTLMAQDTKHFLGHQCVPLLNSPNG